MVKNHDVTPINSPNTRPSRIKWIKWHDHIETINLGRKRRRRSTAVMPLTVINEKK